MVFRDLAIQSENMRDSWARTQVMGEQSNRPANKEDDDERWLDLEKKFESSIEGRLANASYRRPGPEGDKEGHSNKVKLVKD